MNTEQHTAADGLRVILSDKGGRAIWWGTFAEFVLANPDGLTLAEIAEAADTLLHGFAWRFGGGAAPEFVLQLASPEVGGLRFEYDYLGVALKELNAALTWRERAFACAAKRPDLVKPFRTVMRCHAKRSRRAFNGELLPAI